MSLLLESPSVNFASMSHSRVLFQFITPACCTFLPHIMFHRRASSDIYCHWSLCIALVTFG